MRLNEKFSKPENFDPVADGAGWVMYVGGDDWEMAPTRACVVFPSDEQIKRVWFVIDHKKCPEQSKFSDETRAFAKKAWQAWKRAATEAHKNKNHGTRSWQEAFKTALKSKEMRTYVRDSGVETTSWNEVKESAESIVRRLLDDEEEEGVAELCGPLDPKDTVNNYHWPPIVNRSNTSFQYNYGRLVRPEDKVGTTLPFDPPTPEVKAEVERLSQMTLGLKENEEPEPEPVDTRSEVDRLLPVDTYRFGGNTMIHAPGLIAIAQHRWKSRSKKEKAGALEMIKCWPGAPEEVYLKILNGQCEIAEDEHTAVITIKKY